MTAGWHIDPWPTCGKHVFLAHVREDRERLAQPISRQLREIGLIPWVDFVEGKAISRWEYPLEVLRHEILGCRHVVYLLTQAALTQGRGWMAAERAYAEHLQSLLSHDGEPLIRVELTLRFVQAGSAGDVDRLIDQSIWHPLVTRSRRIVIHDPDELSGPIEQAVEQIEGFIQREIERGAEITPDIVRRFNDNRYYDREYLSRIQGTSLELMD